MDNLIKLKYWFYTHYWWVLVLISLFVFAILVLLKEQTATIATAIGAILSLVYFIQKQKLEELKIFREIFKECNSRYDSMNEDLAVISKKHPDEVAQKEKMIVIDYLNLCGEEYLYYKQGIIEPSEWQAWNNGMTVIVSAESIQKIWEEESKTGSYYELPIPIVNN